MTQSKSATVGCWLLVLATFPCTGFLVGWLTGASNSPVVATLLPLVFGVAGAVGFRALDRRNEASRIDQALAAFDAPTRDAVRNALRGALPSNMLVPGLWSLGVLLFCAACFGGVKVGVDERLPRYPPLESLVRLNGLSAEEQAMLHHILWDLRAQGVSRAQAESAFRTSVTVALQETDPIKRAGCLAQVAENLKASKVTRGVASEDPPIPARSSEPG